MSNTQPSAPYAQRQARLSAILDSAGGNALVLNPGSSLIYLTGLNFHLMERPVVAFFVPHAPPIIVMPELEGAKLVNLTYPIRSFPYGEDPQTWTAVFKQAADAAQIAGRTVGVEPTRLRFLELRLLEAAAPGAKFVSAETSLADLRMCKDESEIAAMRKAVQIAQQGLQATIPAIRPGISERELAGELTLQLLKAGSESEFPFTPIVSGGPNSANPHAVPTERKLQNGDLLVIDWGASFGGYVSDLTRTFAIGKVDAELVKIVEIAVQANAAGRAAGKPGAAAEAVDQAARAVIEKAGYGQYFTHRTGHGLGMEGHEAPYMRSGNLLPLQPGMTYTVEPGIYLPGRGGVRIEDDVVVTADGSESLSDMGRDLYFIDA